jgi:hypothetical protein
MEFPRTAHPRELDMLNATASTPDHHCRARRRPTAARRTGSCIARRPQNHHAKRPSPRIPRPPSYLNRRRPLKRTEAPPVIEPFALDTGGFNPRNSVVLRAMRGRRLCAGGVISRWSSLSREVASYGRAIRPRTSASTGCCDSRVGQSTAAAAPPRLWLRT